MALAARDELELGGDERVQADVDGVQARLSQPGQLPTQRQTVRRYSNGPVKRGKWSSSLKLCFPHGDDACFLFSPA